MTSLANQTLIIIHLLPINLQRQGPPIKVLRKFINTDMCHLCDKALQFLKSTLYIICNLSLDCLTLSLIGLDAVYHIHYMTQMVSLNFLQLVLFFSATCVSM